MANEKLRHAAVGQKRAVLGVKKRLTLYETRLLQLQLRLQFQLQWQLRASSRLLSHVAFLMQVLAVVAD